MDLPRGSFVAAPVVTLARGAPGFATRWFRDLQLVWKLLVPLLTGALVVGLLGSFLVVRTLSSRAQTSLDEDLFRRTVLADDRVRDQALYLVEAVRFGANIQGLAEAVRSGSVPRVRTLAASVSATRGQLDLLVVTDAAGRALVQIDRSGHRFTVTGGRDWSHSPLVARVRSISGRASLTMQVGLEPLGGTTLLAVATPVRLTGAGGFVGVMLSGVRVDTVAARAAEDVGGTVAFFAGRTPLGHAGTALPPPPAGVGPHTSVRRQDTVDGTRLAIDYSPVKVNGQPLATLAVSRPTGPVLGSVVGARNRLLGLLLLGLLGLVGFGALLNHVILRQVRPLVSVNRALGHGDLSARAPVLGRDELGELAVGLNLMAEQLEAAQTEAEHLVSTRTLELERLYRELAQLSTERSQTFAALSHEFRNDLVVISGYAELMVDPDFVEIDANWRLDYGATIQRSVRSALERVTESLELARSEQRTMELALEANVHLQTLLADLRPTILALARRADLRVVWDVPEALPGVTADPRRLREVVMNLTSNAMKYTRSGGSVRITTGVIGDNVELSVADTGVGIPADELSHVFEPFYRVVGTQTQRGESSSGVGLAHVKRVIEAHGGSVAVVSEVGQGSTFTVRLPMRRGPRGGRTPAPARRRSKAVARPVPS